MKTSNKSSIATGIVLLALAAFFSICLILQPFDFGVSGPGHDNFFFFLGNMLTTVYGFSSILIPVFLFVAGLSCFATTWTARKTMRLLTALVPFFTSVITENICRSVLKNPSPFSIVKILITLITGIMLIVIEFLGVGIIADKINDGTIKDLFKSKPRTTPKKSPINNVKVEPVFEETPVVENEISSETEIPENDIEPVEEDIFDAELSKVTPSFTQPEPVSEPEETVEIEEPVQTIQDEPSLEDVKPIKPLEPIPSFAPASVYPKKSFLDKLVSKVKSFKKNSDDELEIEEYEPSENKEAEDNNSTAEFMEEVSLTPETKSEEPANDYEEDDDMERNPSSMITQEEYAALTMPVPEDSYTTDNTEDELEWNNLPPAPTSLPPEYDEDFDVDMNDPDLEFPPKEVEPEPVPATVDESELFEEFDAIANEPSNHNEPDEIDYQDAGLSFDVDFGDDDDTSDGEQSFTYETKNEEDFSEEYPEDFYEEDETLPINDFPVESVPSKKYSDSVIENPAFSYGITIHDEDSEPAKNEKKVEKPVQKPRFPTKIKLNSSENDEIDDDFTEFGSPAINAVTPAEVQDNGEIFEEDVPYEDSDFDIPVEPVVAAAAISSVAAAPIAKAAVSAPVTAGITSAASAAPVRPEGKTLPPSAAAKLQEQKQPKSFPSATTSVFSEMEADIRRSQPSKVNVRSQQTETVIPQDNEEIDNQYIENEFQPEVEDPADYQYEEQFVNDDFSNDFIEEETPAPEQEVTIEGIRPVERNNATTLHAAGANNLTADELTDFFNAQQEENTPKTKEIEANPPRIGNRAYKKGPYVIPSDLLTAYKDDQYWIIDEATKQASLNLKQTLSEFNIEAEIIGIKKGPVVTMFELLPAPGVKLSKIVALQDNIALSLAAQSVRIVAPIPGKQAVGIEVPNKHRSVVGFREIIEMDLPEWNKMAVPVVLGKDILGKAQLIDLAKTPHMLIAGATGSGKSVCVNSLILSILYKRSFRDVKMILVDPKVVELKLYNNIPHLLTPVITEPKKALQALQWCLCEMERRYALLDGMGVRDISNYNIKIKEQKIATEKLPYLVVIIDEFADLMATSGKELETIVARLTAMSRAVGIHLVLATQRPSVNVITGLIKANIPTRIAFMVASRTDSNIIIDTIGAEKLLGRGDMLYASATDPAPIRIQGTFISDNEVEDVVNAVKEYGEPDYIDEEIFVEDEEDSARDLFGEPMDDDDPLYDQALEIVVQAGKASASYIQRRLKIGYNRAARLVEEMEERGIVGPANGSKPREVIHIP